MEMTCMSQIMSCPVLEEILRCSIFHPPSFLCNQSIFHRQSSVALQLQSAVVIAPFFLASNSLIETQIVYPTSAWFGHPACSLTDLSFMPLVSMRQTGQSF